MRFIRSKRVTSACQLKSEIAILFQQRLDCSQISFCLGGFTQMFLVLIVGGGCLLAECFLGVFFDNFSVNVCFAD